MASLKVIASLKASAVYKKKQGSLAIANDQTSIIWTPKDSGSGVKIDVSEITNLQQTPETSAKVIIKIFEKPFNAPEPVTHLFTFDSSNPREEANAIKGILSDLIVASKDAESIMVKANGTSASEANALGHAIISKLTTGNDRFYDDAQLKSNIDLQRSLLEKDPELKRTFNEARGMKSENISDFQFNAQFWSTRTNILRSHAIDTHQMKGQYNVLAALRPQLVNGEQKVYLSEDQLPVIYRQFPLVKRAWDENVPKVTNEEFWRKFFQSRLYKKLMGERINPDVDSPCAIFDKYLEAANDPGPSQRLLTLPIPRIIDIEGNEENQGGSKNISGNRLDWTMRPSDVSRVPIVRTLNSLSEKIMAHVNPSEINPADPIGMNEETFNSLQLRDLQGAQAEHRIKLNITDQSRIASLEKSEISAEAALYAKQKPSEVLSAMRPDVGPSSLESNANGRYDLKRALGVLDDSDSEDEEKVPHVGSKSSLIEAQKQTFQGIKARRILVDSSNTEATQSGLSDGIFSKLKITQATTTEFLHHFWLAFYSGNSDRAEELAKLVETLNRSMDRINAVAADAEKDRKVEMDREREIVRQFFLKTNRKKDPKFVGGGKEVVLEMMQPTIRVLQKATTEYRKALAAEGVDTS